MAISIKHRFTKKSNFSDIIFYVIKNKERYSTWAY